MSEAKSSAERRSREESGEAGHFAEQNNPRSEQIAENVAFERAKRALSPHFAAICERSEHFAQQNSPKYIKRAHFIAIISQVIIKLPKIMQKSKIKSLTSPLLLAQNVQFEQVFPYKKGGVFQDLASY